ncbi:MAG: hypothetical protein ACLPKB_10280 [Xanthobacteraceae bacterium]
MSVALAPCASLAMFFDRHGPTILSTFMVPAFASTGRSLVITLPIAVTVTINGNATGTDPYIGLGQRDRIARHNGPREGR